MALLLSLRAQAAISDVAASWTASKMTNCHLMIETVDRYLHAVQHILGLHSEGSQRHWACTSGLGRAQAGDQQPKLLPVLESGSLLRLGFEL